MKLGTHGLPRRSAVIARRRRQLRIAGTCIGLAIFLFLAWVGWEIWPRRSDVVADVTAALSLPLTAPLRSVQRGVPAPHVDLSSIVPEGATPPAAVSTAGQLAPAPPAPEETSSETAPIAAASPEGGSIHVPFMQAWGESLMGGATPDGFGASPRAGLTLPHDMPLWPGPSGGGSGPQFGAPAGGAGPESVLAGVRGGGTETLPQVTFLSPSTGGTNTTGQTTGQSSGQTPGQTSGSTTGQTTGETTGETTGYTPGGTTGQTTGQTTGATTGQTSGDTRGGTTGTTTGDVLTTGVPTGGTSGGLNDTDGSVPEPATWTLLGLGACGAVVRAWRARRS